MSTDILSPVTNLVVTPAVEAPTVPATTDTKVEPKKANKKDPNAPKKPKTAYFIWAWNEDEDIGVSKIKQEFPDLKHSQHLSKAGQIWKSIFRGGGAPKSRRQRMMVVLNSVFLHLHPVRLPKHAVKLKFTWCSAKSFWRIFC